MVSANERGVGFDAPGPGLWGMGRTDLPKRRLTTLALTPELGPAAQEECTAHEDENEGPQSAPAPEAEQS
jgi:hypothetical protein